MIALLLIVAGVALVTAPGLLVPSLRLSASEWARTAAAGLVLGAVAIEAGLMIVALPAVLRAVDATGLASVCDWAAVGGIPGGDVVSWGAALLAVVFAGRSGRAARRAHRRACAVAVEPWLGRHEHRGSYELVVLPTDRLLAMSVPGARPQVLISDGLVGFLASDELDLVVRHEEMHHRLKHWRYVMLAVGVDRGLRPVPFAARSTRALRAALDAWADEAAVGGCRRDRVLVRRSLAAIDVRHAERRSTWADRLARHRVSRLEHVAGRTRLLGRLGYMAPSTALAVAAVMLLIGWTDGAHHAVALPGNC